MAYDDQSTYNKFNAECECEDKDNCGCKDDSCGCCPVGLVEVQDNTGEAIACLSPSDAEQYMANTFRCPDGYVRVVSGGKFLCCLTVTDYVAYLATT